MARTCPVSGKSYQRIKSRSHSMRISIKRRKPNFIVKKVGNKKIKLTARAWRTIRNKQQNLKDVLAQSELS
jgi:ribosomal protein L28